MSPNGQPQRNVVLLTGATGMVGSQLMAKLLASGVSVAVLARDSVQRSRDPDRRTTISASGRIETLLSRFESCPGRPLARPTVLCGDLTSDSLGLDPESLNWIAGHVNSVIHSAASLSFRPASESSSGEPYRTNVLGTANLIKVCRDAGIDDFHYVSTAYVCGLRSGRVFEADHDCGQQFANDYEHSKCQAENLVRSESSWQSPTIYRPSIVIDSSGLSPVTEDRTVYGAYSLFETL
ncbi:MAG TPA: beta keto-acyl synthase, partial [Planctomycetaceae bacterium]|nr:beta keto-acyl synthase [Planctomycetaceae bacterium]